MEKRQDIHGCVGEILTVASAGRPYLFVGTQQRVYNLIKCVYCEIKSRQNLSLFHTLSDVKMDY